MKVSLSKIFQTSTLLTTKSGKELAELITTFADFVKQVVPVLENGIAFEDNWRGEAKVIELSSDREQIVGVALGKAVTDIWVGRVYSAQQNMLVGFSWWIDSDGRPTVKAKFDPAPTSPIEVRLLVSYA